MECEIGDLSSKELMNELLRAGDQYRHMASQTKIQVTSQEYKEARDYFFACMDEVERRARKLLGTPIRRPLLSHDFDSPT
jgi:hypothetical protein